MRFLRLRWKIGIATLHVKARRAGSREAQPAAARRMRAASLAADWRCAPNPPYESWMQRHRDSTEYWVLPACNPGGSLEITAGGARVREKSGTDHSIVLLQAKKLLRAYNEEQWGWAFSLGSERDRSVHHDHEEEAVGDGASHSERFNEAAAVRLALRPWRILTQLADDIVKSSKPSDSSRVNCAPWCEWVWNAQNK